MYSVTQAFVEWLDGKDFAASTYPPETGTEFVTVERTGGGTEEYTDHPMIALQAWAQTEPDAEAMATEIRNALVMGDYPEGVVKVEVNAGPYPFWDEYTRLPRYQTLYECTCQLKYDLMEE